MTENKVWLRGMQRVELAERQQTISLFRLGDGWVRKDGKPLLSLHLYFRSGAGGIEHVGVLSTYFGLVFVACSSFLDVCEPANSLIKCLSTQTGLLSSGVKGLRIWVPFQWRSK